MNISYITQMYCELRKIRQQQQIEEQGDHRFELHSRPLHLRSAQVCHDNTKRNSAVCVRGFARYFIGRTIGEQFLTEPHMLTYYNAKPSGRSKWEVGCLKEFLFASCVPKESVAEEVQKKIMHYLIEFAVNYKKCDGKDAAPETMTNYIYAIQSTFKLWGFPLNPIEGPIFADEEHGLAAVLDKKFSTQKSEGYESQGHNTLSKMISVLYSRHLPVM